MELHEYCNSAIYSVLRNTVHAAMNHLRQIIMCSDDLEFFRLWRLLEQNCAKIQKFEFCIHLEGNDLFALKYL